MYESEASRQPSVIPATLSTMLRFPASISSSSQSARRSFPGRLGPQGSRQSSSGPGLPPGRQPRSHSRAARRATSSKGSNRRHHQRTSLSTWLSPSTPRFQMPPVLDSSRYRLWPRDCSAPGCDESRRQASMVSSLGRYQPVSLPIRPSDSSTATALRSWACFHVSARARSTDLPLACSFPCAISNRLAHLRPC